MSLLSRFRSRTRAMLRGDAVERDLDREMAGWVDELAARYEVQGLDPREARRRALAETGGIEHVKDRVRDVRARWFFDWHRGSSLDRLRFDLSTAVRSMLSTPGPTVAAMLTLAAAVGVNLAVFGLVDRALLSPPAHVAYPGQVFTVAFHGPPNAPATVRMTTGSYVAFKAIRDQVPALAGAAAFQRTDLSVVIDGEQRRVSALLISGTYFDVLGVRPMFGSGILPEHDDLAKATPVVAVSYAFWRSALGGDRGVLGHRVNIRGTDYAVVGVMPEGFSGHSATAVDMWVPLAAAMRGTAGWEHDAFRNVVSVVVRLASGTSVDAAEAQASSAVGRGISLSGVIGADVAATERRVAWWLTGVSILLLVIGLANTGTLLVVRAAKRRYDLIVRAALGASRPRLLAQAFLEAALLSIAATALSLATASWFDEAVRRVLFPNLVGRSGLTTSTTATAALAGVVMMAVAGVANAWQFPLLRRPGAMTSAARPGRAKSRMLTALLLVQTTLSVLLLAGAAMIGLSFHHLASQDFGMRMDGVIVAEFEAGPATGMARGEFFENALEQVAALPGVEIATLVDALPFGGFNVPPISVPGRAEPPSVDGQLPHLLAATPEFMRILDVQVVEGRTFTAADGRGAPIVIVNQTMARRVWPGESAIGKCIRIGFDPDFDPALGTGPEMPSAKVPCREIIGVVRDVRQRSLVPVDNEARLMQYFVPFAQIPRPPFMAGPLKARGILLRSRLTADELAPAIRRLIVGQRTNLPFLRVVPYTQFLDRQMRPWRLATTLLVLFSSLALAVAAIGLYAAFAHAVAERRAEMAIRLAIGARPIGIVRMVLREALVVAAIGAVAGCAAATVAGRRLESLLFETAPSNPLVLGSAAAAMLIIAFAATLLPARSASKADPNVLLRVQ
jgi:putative ABC transport system permease protein